MGSEIGSGTIGLKYIGGKRVGAIFEMNGGRDIYGIKSWREGGVVEAAGVIVS
jgi:hypothetical protein